MVVRIALEAAQILLLDPWRTVIRGEGAVLVEGMLRPFDQTTYVLVVSQWIAESVVVVAVHEYIEKRGREKEVKISRGLLITSLYFIISFQLPI